jgi:phospholipid-binding lipoprotein MlaA
MRSEAGAAADQAAGARPSVGATTAPPAPEPTPSEPAPAEPAPAEPVPAVTPAAAPAPAAAAPAPKPANGEIVVSGERHLDKIDPLMAVNKASYQAMQKVDDIMIAPIAHAYRDGLPRPIRMGLHNFLFNLTEPVNAMNHLLQLHPGKALQTAARFGINSTIGIGGLIDVAKKKPFNIHYRPNGFADTLGYWGVGPGPYMFLPLVGPTTLRDIIGTLLDKAFLPGVVGYPLKNRYYVTASGILTTLDYRVVIDQDLARVRQTSSPYSSYRQIYLKTRFEEIEALHGRGPLADGETGMAPFAKPLHPVPDQAPAAPASAPSAASAPAAVAPPTPVAPPPVVFVAYPVVQSHPVVQPLPADYKPHSGH